MTTVREQLAEVRRRLADVSDEADSEAKIILAHVYGTSPGGLIMRLLHEARSGEKVAQIVKKRLEGVPLAYVLHSAPFYGRDYYVDERVLIPRFDTECVAEKALGLIREHRYAQAADVCCGSGCIGITLLEESALREVVFTDISAGALTVCRRNARRLTGTEKARFCRGDLFGALEAPVDLIVSNPPYISLEEYGDLEPQVRDHEPRLALFGGTDGLDFYRKLAGEGKGWLHEGGSLLVEIGAFQKEAVLAIFRDAGFTAVGTGTDLAGRPRWVCGRKD